MGFADNGLSQCSAMPCLTENQVVEFVAAQLGPQAMREVEDELDRCADCRHLVCEYARSTLASWDGDAEEGRDDEVGDGATLGRFELLDYLGAGAMGVVFLARDPKLEREVALKVLSPRLRNNARASKLLVAEAQAMAQVKHPNVLTIYDSGNVGDTVFLAMERAQGTLHQWLAEEPRTWRTIVRVFAGAAAGIAAAHKAGVVHRDIKPSNLLMSDSGKALVADFGLALRARDSTDADSDSLVGTLVYLSPEELLGSAGDEQSEQFSFCVALYEALVGRRPFMGDNRTALEESHRADRVQFADVPRPIRPILRRGLSIEAAARFPSMQALHLALESSVRSVRNKRVGLAVAGVSAAALLLGLRLASPEQPACRRAATFWSAEQSDGLQASFLAMDPNAGALASELTSRFEAYDAVWNHVQLGTCRATRVEGTQSGTMLDKRMVCLSRLRRDFESLAQALQSSNVAVLEHAKRSALALTSPTDCSAERLVNLKVSQAPGDAVQDELSKARTQYLLGEYASAESAMTSLLERDPSPYVKAHAGALLGNSQRKLLQALDASKSLLAAGNAAAEIGDDALATAIWILLAEVEGYQLDRHEAGEAYLQAAETTLRRLGGDDAQQARLWQTRGLIASGKGEHAVAQKLHTKALEMRKTMEGGTQLQESESLTLLGISQNDAGNVEEGEKSLRRAIALRVQALGDRHAEVALLRMTLGQILAAASKFDESIVELEIAKGLVAKGVGVAHPDYASALTKIGVVYLHQGKYDEAQTLFEQSLDIRRTHYGPNDSEVGRALVNMGSLYYNAGKFELAAARYAQALEVMKRAVEPDHPDLAAIHIGVAVSASALGNLDQALRHNTHAYTMLKNRDDQPMLLANVLGNMALLHAYRDEWAQAVQRYAEAIAVHEKTLGPDHAHSAYLLTGMGEAHQNLGNHSEAMKFLSRAVVSQEQAGMAPQRIAEARILMAYSMWHSPAKRKEALALAVRGRDDIKATRPEAAKGVDAWLRKHR